MTADSVSLARRVLLLIPLFIAAYAHGTCVVAVTPATATLSSGGGPLGFAAHTTPAACNQSVTWTATAGTITATGTSSANYTAPLVTQITTVTVTATRVADPSQHGTATVTVNPPTLQSITVTPGFNMLTIPNGVQLTATGNFSDGTHVNITSSSGWSSSNNSVATVNLGLVSSVANGTANMTASKSGITSPAGQVDVGTAADWYVATNGRDTWSGTKFEPTPDGMDGPFASISGGAKPAVENALSHGRSTPIKVLVRGGNYYQQAISLSDPADSGLSSTVTVTWQNYPNETPVLSGGKVITGWSFNTTLPNGTKQYVTNLAGGTTYFESLFYNSGQSGVGHRRQRPRLGASFVGSYYNLTLYTVASQTTNCNVFDSTNNVWICADKIKYTNTPLPVTGNQVWANLNPPAGHPTGCTQAGNSYPPGEIAVLVFHYWSVSKMLVDCVDATNKVIYFTSPTNSAADPNNYPIMSHRFVVENAKDALTEAGQFFLDRSQPTWQLFYNAYANEDPTNTNTDTAVIPQNPLASPWVLSATGLKYVTFRGLTFEHDNWTVPPYVSSGQPGGYPSLRQDTGISTAVSCVNCQNITFDADIITQTSGGGIEFVTNSTSSVSTANTITSNGIFDVGGMGIRIGVPVKSGDTDTNVPNNITVTNNLIEGYGRAIPGAIGLVQGDGNKNTYMSNDIYDGYHSGVEICALNCVPGAQSTSATHDIKVDSNHIFDIGLGITDDMGGIYYNLYWTSTSNEVMNNRIHDVNDAKLLDPADGYWGNGIYLDNYTSGVTVKNNLVYRTSSSGLNITGGPPGNQTPVPAANVLTNNIVAYGRLGLIRDGNPYTVPNQPNSYACPLVATKIFDATDNLFYFDRNSASNPSFTVQLGCEYSCTFSHINFHNWQQNLYWNPLSTFNGYANAFHLQVNDVEPTKCGNPSTDWTYYTPGQWSSTYGEDTVSVIRDPLFKNPTCNPVGQYPADDYELLSGSQNPNFVPFDVNAPGRTNKLINPNNTEDVPETFQTSPFNKCTDF